MRYLSLFSGIECATLAFAPLGWECVALSEVDPFCCALLAHHYPDVPNLGDVVSVDWSAYRGAVDVVCGGSPCQSFSVAGRRQGLDDPRGNLMHDYLRAVAEAAPRWVLWENVPGVLSQDAGRAFGALLGALEECGYGWAYRVLDAQYLGVAQRRRRVYVVGCLGDWRGAVSVLFERDSLRGHPAPGTQAWEGAAACAGGGPGGGVHGGRTLVMASAQGGAEVACDLSPTMTASHDGPPIVFDTTTITSPWNMSDPRPGDPCHTLSARAHPPTLISGATVRRLTPRECERLQGIPDDYTRIPYRGRPAERCADTPRYRAIGNAWAVPVIRWIAEGIEAVEGRGG